MFFLIIHLTECLAYIIIYIRVLCVWNDHHSLDFLLLTDERQNFDQQMFTVGNGFNGVGIEHEFA